MIQVETIPTVPSTFGLSLLSPISDNKDYLQNHIILKIGGDHPEIKGSPAAY
jgi:hypothetical protein